MCTHELSEDARAHFGAGLLGERDDGHAQRRHRLHGGQLLVGLLFLFFLLALAVL